MYSSADSPAHTFTLSDFIEMGKTDELVYQNFSILRLRNGILFSEETVIDYYMEELRKLCTKVDGITAEDIVHYRYAPDLLAYDMYGSTQLDFIVLLCNGMIDPKEFNFKRKYLMLPYQHILNEFLSAVYNSEKVWLDTNRSSIPDQYLRK